MKPSRAARNDSTKQPSETPAAQNGKAELLDIQSSPAGQEEGTRAKERAEAGKRIRDFVEAVLSKGDHPHSITIQVATKEKREKVLAETGVDIGGAREILIDDRVVHAQRDHLSLTLDDWAQLPDIAETFTESYLGKEKGNPKTRRLIFVKRGDPKDHVYVAEFANGRDRGGERLSLITFFKASRAGIDEFLRKNRNSDGRHTASISPGSTSKDRVPTTSLTQSVEKVEEEIKGSSRAQHRG